MMVVIWESTENGEPASISSMGPIGEMGGDYICVNGVKFDMTISEVKVDGQSGELNDLQSGQVVIVTGILEGDGRNGVAKSVSFKSHFPEPSDSAPKLTNKADNLDMAAMDLNNDELVVSYSEGGIEFSLNDEMFKRDFYAADNGDQIDFSESPSVSHPSKPDKLSTLPEKKD